MLMSCDENEVIVRDSWAELEALCARLVVEIEKTGAHVTETILSATITGGSCTLNWDE